LIFGAKRNVWIADAPGFEARQVTHYQGDDRQQIVEEIIFPDEIHDFLLWKSWIRGYQATADFFGRQFGMH